LDVQARDNVEWCAGARPGLGTRLAVMFALCCAWLCLGPALATASAQPLSVEPSKTQPYLACPPPARRHAACQSVIVPPGASLAAMAASSSQPMTGGIDGSGLTPTELQSAYQLPSATSGSGQTVALVDAYGDPTAESDLATYRSAYGLVPCTAANGCFTKVNQSGGTNYPPLATNADGDWELEQALDLDMVSAVCPKCNILLVEATTSSIENLTEAEDEAAALGATEISNSWAAPEFPGETELDPAFEHPGIPITAASGDYGYDNHEPPDDGDAPNYPASSPNVIAVGGTVLSAAKDARGWSEKVWPRSGSGCSRYEPKPWFQTDAECAGRTTNDVAAVAEDLSVYDTSRPVGSSELPAWTAVGGTSASTPIVAAVEALSSPAARSLGAGAFYESPSSLFDITSGANGTCTVAYLCSAEPGYDGPTGVGTPDGAFPSTAPAPVLTSVSPDQGPVAGATKVTITGSGFLGTTAVDFGSRPAASWTVVSPTQITAVAPAGSDASGYVDVGVLTRFGASPVGAQDQFAYGPTIASVSPTSGPVAGGTKVTLTGTGFEADGGVAQVYATSPRQAMQSVEVLSDGELTFVTPATVAGTTTFEVTTTGVAGQTVAVATASTQTFQYGSPQPAVSSVSPEEGAVAGGTQVTVDGSGFTGATAVDFGSTPASSVEVLSGTQIRAVSPPATDATGYSDVTVTTPGGTSPTTAADQFIYGPTVTSISPASGSAAGATKVTVTGTGFDSDGGVAKVEMNIGGATATPTVVSDTELTFLTPPSSPTSANASATVQLRTLGVSGQAHTGYAASPPSFSYLALPSVESVFKTPDFFAEGAVAGGTAVTILGAGFTGATAVDFGAVPASSFTVVSDTEITTTSPPGSDASGWVDVTVVGPGGRSTTSVDDQFVYTATITQLSPASGPAAGGTPITITGTGFDSDGGVEAVTVGVNNTHASLSAVKVLSDTTITGTMPAFPTTGEVLLQVRMKGTPGQQKPSGPAAIYTYLGPPTVTAVKPASGPSYGGQTVTILGTGFLPGATVRIGNAASAVEVLSPTEIRARTAASEPGVEQVVVSDEDGTSTGGPTYEYVYAPPPPVTVLTGAASMVTQTSATLNATVNPDGREVSECEFEYGTSEDYGASVPCGSQPGSGETPVAVSGALAGLAADRTYHFRIVAANTGGRAFGSDQTFTTPPEPPSVESAAVSSLGQVSATLSAIVDPNGGTVSECRFEYGTSERYGSSVACASLPAPGMEPAAVSAALTGLTPATTYHFRILAANQGGSTSGPDASFTTPSPALPELGICNYVAAAMASYENEACTKPSTGGDTGHYEWQPWPAGHNNAGGAIVGTTKLETVGKASVRCASGSLTGEYTGSQTSTEIITLTGCEAPGALGECQSAGAGAGEIRTYPLEGRLGFIKGGSKPTVGWELAPASGSALAGFACGATTMSLTGSVIAPFGKADKRDGYFTAKFKAAKGRQKPEAFEGLPKDVLDLGTGLGEEQAGLTTRLSLGEGGGLEIKAIP
jgi:IPT/TIG domain